MLNPKVTWKAGYQPSGELLLKTSIRFLDRLQGEISRLLMSENPIFHLYISLDGGEEAVDKIALEIEINTDKEGKLNRAEVCQIRREYFEQFGYRYSDGNG